jgi:hypothetical protein
VTEPNQLRDVNGQQPSQSKLNTKHHPWIREDRSEVPGDLPKNWQTTSMNRCLSAHK